MEHPLDGKVDDGVGGLEIMSVEVVHDYYFGSMKMLLSICSVDEFLEVCQLIVEALFEDEATFGPEVEEEVDDAEIGEKSCALLEHLVVGLGMERGIVVKLSFGRDECAQVGGLRQVESSDIVGACGDLWREL